MEIIGDSYKKIMKMDNFDGKFPWHGEFLGDQLHLQ